MFRSCVETHSEEPKYNNIIDTAALAAYGLMQQRRKDILQKPKTDTQTLLDKLPVRKAKKRVIF